MKIKLFDENLIGQPGLSRYIDCNVGWDRTLVDYDVGIYVDRMCHSQTIDKSKINFAWLIEPSVINGENYQRIKNNYTNFKYVFSHDTSLEKYISNFKYIPHGGTWLRNNDIDIFHKTKMISYIFSNKQWKPYHEIRFKIYNEIKEKNIVDSFGSGCDKRIEFKIEALRDYMFSIVVENNIEDAYFTEKILDCFLTGTIPIYIGTKRISEFFNEEGIVRIEDHTKISEVLSMLNETHYTSKIDSIIQNFELAKKYIHPELIIQKIINEKESNII